MVVQRADVELAHAVEVKGVFNDDRAAENAEEPADDQRDDREQRVAPGVGVDDDLLPHALVPGGLDVVHAQRVDHGGADVTGHAAQGAEGHDDKRQGEVIELIPERAHAGILGAGRSHAADREPAQQHGEDVNKHQGDDVDRDTVTDDGEDLGEVIKLAALVHRAVDAQGNGDAQGKDGGKDVDEDRVADGRQDHFHYVLLEVGRVTEIALQQAVELACLLVGRQAHPSGVTHQDIIVQAHLFPQFLIHAFIDFGLEGFLHTLQLVSGRVAGDQIIQTVHQEGDNEEYQDQIGDSS